MKRLHLSNIANMAYGYSRILRESGFESDVLCYDLDHWLSDPSSSIGFKGYPDWFKRTKTIDFLNRKDRAKEELSKDWLEALQRYSFRLGEVSLEEISAYKGYVDAFQEEFFEKYDVIYGYAYGAIPPLLYAERKYIPVDLGSLRGLSKRNDSFSKILSYSLKAAPHIIVTNPDVRGDCNALGLQRYTFVPHPVDEDLWTPAADAGIKRDILKKELDADFVILAPARQDWVVKGSNEIIQGIVDFSRLSGDRVKCILIEWGDDLLKSKQLVKELGAENIFHWIEMQSEIKLKGFYNAADALIDQVGEAKTFGLTTPKAMAAGIPVLTKFDASMHEWCYSEMPPLLAIINRQDITRHLCRLASEGGYSKDVIADQRNWIDQYHSKKVIAEKFSEAEANSLSNDDACRIYYSLNQKKNEIFYEIKYSEIYDVKYHNAVAYKLMDQRLIDWMKSHLDNRNGLKILDLGCGPGSMISYLRQIGNAEICGIDISPAFVDIAKKRHPEVEFKVGDAEVIPYADATFDAVLCSGMLHHIPDLEQVFSEIQRVLKPNGLMFAREPNEDNFAARYPQISFAHLVLKHLIHISKRMPAIVEPEEHEFHIDFDYRGFVELLSQSFDVVDMQFGQPVSYFYDMLFDAKSAAGLEQMEKYLKDTPGLNVLVACRVSVEQRHVAQSVQDTIQSLSVVKAISEKHIRSFVDFSIDHLQTEDNYIASLLSRAKDPLVASNLRGLGRSAHIEITESGFTVKKSSSWFGKLYRLISPSLFEWNVSDYEGRKLFDSGVITIGSTSFDVGCLSKALTCFRDYAFVVVKVPRVFCLLGDITDGISADLVHSYIISKLESEAEILYVVSPKLFTVENLKYAVSAMCGSELKDELMLKLGYFHSVAPVNFSVDNLYSVLVLGEKDVVV